MKIIRKFLGKVKTTQVPAGYKMEPPQVKLQFANILLNETIKITLKAILKNIPKIEIKSFQHQLPKIKVKLCFCYMQYSFHF